MPVPGGAYWLNCGSVSRLPEGMIKPMRAGVFIALLPFPFGSRKSVQIPLLTLISTNFVFFVKDLLKDPIPWQKSVGKTRKLRLAEKRPLTGQHHRSRCG